MQRKVTEAFSVRKHKHEKDKYPNMPDIWFEVLQPKARGKDQDEWAFEVVNAESWGVPVELDNNGRVDNPEDTKKQALIREANDRFKTYNWTTSGTSYTDLDKHLTSQGVTSNRQKKKLFDIGLEKNIIYKADNGKYHYNGMKDLPNDQTEQLPFDKPKDENVPF